MEKKHYYHKELYKLPKTREIKIIEQKGDFWGGVNEKGGYWKKYKYYRWKKMEFKCYEPVRKLDKIVYADKTCCITKGKTNNGCLIKRDCEMTIKEKQMKQDLKQLL